MIQPDVNVLVYAYRREAEDHAAYSAWLNGVLSGREELGLVDTVLAAFLRVVTNPRIFTKPAPTADALRFVTALRTAPRARPLHATPATWNRFAEIVRGDRAVRGNLVPDAWLAAVALSHGSRLATADRGFARFTGLDWFEPLAEVS
ncbi:TA system VapC family ribonuclease toxin [Sporichthya sp.]|uniref:TA system VapC family ribonuclease toxin n=1 Tax=Sporichthya sp. TaxID=65475 RepID=UPI0017ECA85E|nr:TA system VapC family ribonuclease toxin [Sporichthya sp.]MBA3741805.1 PIN domain-containing protein [Sporichthya sp.]